MLACGRYYPCCVQRLIECHHGGGAAAKYTSDSYDILRCNCNHFTEDLCMAVCGKQVCAPTTLSCARPLSPSVRGLALLTLGALSCSPLA
jgi:hypothetical protein